MTKKHAPNQKYKKKQRVQKHNAKKCTQNAIAKVQFAFFLHFNFKPRFLHLFFQNHVCLVWFAFFRLCFFFWAFVYFFRTHVCPVGPWSDLHFFACFSISFFVFCRIACFKCFFGMQPLVICASPRLSFFAFLFALFLHFFQDVDILEQAQFDSTNMYRFKTLMSSLCYSLSPILENGE